MKGIYLITGTSSGLGKSLAKHYSETNFVYGISRSESSISNENYTHLAGSITDESFVKNCLGKVLKDHGKLDLLINNAGVASMNHLLTTPLSTIQKVFETNFTGSFLCIREFSKALKNSFAPRIINISSIAAEIEIEGELIYSASKSALNKMTKLAAIELATFNITVNAIALPPFASKLTNGIDKSKLENINKRRIISADIDTEHILHSIDYLKSPMAKHISGEIIRIGGVK